MNQKPCYLSHSNRFYSYYKKLTSLKLNKKGKKPTVQKKIIIKHVNDDTIAKQTKHNEFLPYVLPQVKTKIKKKSFIDEIKTKNG